MVELQLPPDWLRRQIQATRQELAAWPADWKTEAEMTTPKLEPSLEDQITVLRQALDRLTERRFPVQDGPSVPWSYMAPFDRLCQRNHGGQNLERIASQGGLGAAEAEALVTGIDLYRHRGELDTLKRQWFERAERINRWPNGSTSAHLLLAAKYLLLASTGRDDGPDSWSQTRQRWLNAYEQFHAAFGEAS